MSVLNSLRVCRIPEMIMGLAHLMLFEFLDKMIANKFLTLIEGGVLFRSGRFPLCRSSMRLIEIYIIGCDTLTYSFAFDVCGSFTKMCGVAQLIPIL